MIDNLPLFPLNAVLFPGGRLPLRIFESRYMEMIKISMKNQSPFGVCLIREGAEVGEPAVPVAIGCLAQIAEWDMPQLGMLHISARGGRRFRILSRSVQRDGLARGNVEILPEEVDSAPPPELARCIRLLERVIEQHPALLESPHRMDSCAWVSSRLAELLPLPLETKQTLLELDDARERLERLHALIRSD